MRIIPCTASVVDGTVEDLCGTRGTRKVQVRATGTLHLPCPAGGPSMLAKIWLPKGWKMMLFKDIQWWSKSMHLQQ